MKQCDGGTLRKNLGFLLGACARYDRKAFGLFAMYTVGCALQPLVSVFLPKVMVAGLEKGGALQPLMIWATGFAVCGMLLAAMQSYGQNMFLLSAINVRMRVAEELYVQLMTMDFQDTENPDVLRRLGLKVTHATLTETARQAADSGILFNATRLRRTMAAITKRQAEGATGPMPIPKLRPADDVVVVAHEDLPEILTSSYADGISDTILITLSNRRAADYNAAIRTEVLYREDEVMRDDMLIVSRNHYFGKKVGGIDFVANGDILTVVAVYGSETRYGLRFADVRLSLPVPDGEPVEFDIKILLDSLASPEAGISQEAWNALYYGLMADNGPYADRPDDARLRALRTDPYWTALHVKYAYAVTCHKAQGGQWSDVYVDLGYIPDDALNLGLYRWLYTAVTRARRTLYLIAPPDALLEKS